MKWYVLAIVLAACACRSEQAAPAAAPSREAALLAEREPNDDTSSAQAITPPVRISGHLKLGAETDRDVFRLSLDGRRMISAGLSPIADTDVQLELLDGEGRAVVAIDNGGGGEGETLPPTGCEGTCFLAVSGKGTGGDYQLDIRSAPATEESEKPKNDRPEEAQLLITGRRQVGHLSSSQDADWYVFVPTEDQAGHLLDVALTAIDGVRLEVDVLSRSDRRRITRWQSADPGDPIRVRSLALPEDSTGAFLVVRNADAAGDRKKGKDRRWNPSQPYELTVKSWPGVPHLEREPNETADSATPLDPETLTAVGHVAPGGDQDWYAFDLEEASLVRVELSAVPGIDVVASIFSPDEEGRPQELRRADAEKDGSGEVLTNLALSSGRHWVLVRGAARKFGSVWRQTWFNADETYTLRVLVDQDDGTVEREPNDTPDRASPLAMDGNIRGHLHPAGDVDLFRVEVDKPLDVALHLTGVPGVDLSLRVREAGPEGAIVGSVDRGREGADERLVVPFEPGTWLIEVRAREGQSSALNPYSLGLKGRPRNGAAALSP